MEHFILFAATRFGLSPAEARTLTGALLWVIQVHAEDDFACVHALDPDVRRLVDRAPTTLARMRPAGEERVVPRYAGRGRVCGSQVALLRLFAEHGFSLARAGRFARALLGWLSVEVGAHPVRVLVDHTPVLGLLTSPTDQRDSRPMLTITRRPLAANG